LLTQRVAGVISSWANPQIRFSLAGFKYFSTETHSKPFMPSQARSSKAVESYPYNKDMTLKGS